MMRRGKLLVLALVSVACAADAQVAVGQQTGVLCAYVIYSGAKLDSEICGWATTPVGEVVQQGVADIEAYISAHSSLPVAEYRSSYNKGRATMLALSEVELRGYCAGQNPNHPNYFGAMRFEEPQELADQLRELLSRPGPVEYGDCF